MLAHGLGGAMGMDGDELGEVLGINKVDCCY